MREPVCKEGPHVAPYEMARAMCESFGVAPPRGLEWVVVDQNGYPLARFEYREHATDWMDAMKHHEKYWRLTRQGSGEHDTGDIYK